MFSPCRICFGRWGTIKYPCACNASVHLACLNKHRETRLDQSKCEVCLKTYTSVPIPVARVVATYFAQLFNEVTTTVISAIILIGWDYQNINGHFDMTTIMLCMSSVLNGFPVISILWGLYNNPSNFSIPKIGLVGLLVTVAASQVSGYLILSSFLGDRVRGPSLMTALVGEICVGAFAAVCLFLKFVFCIRVDTTETLPIIEPIRRHTASKREPPTRGVRSKANALSPYRLSYGQ
jgi:hypothetical protein